MEADESYRRKERTALVAIVVLASVALASLLVAFSYYCYIRNKVSRRLKNQKSEFSERFSFCHCLFLTFWLVAEDAAEKKKRFLLVLGRMRHYDCFLRWFCFYRAGRSKRKWKFWSSISAAKFVILIQWCEQETRENGKNHFWIWYEKLVLGKANMRYRDCPNLRLWIVNRWNKDFIKKSSLRWPLQKFSLKTNSNMWGDFQVGHIGAKWRATDMWAFFIQLQRHIQNLVNWKMTL